MYVHEGVAGGCRGRGCEGGVLYLLSETIRNDEFVDVDGGEEGEGCVISA